MEILRRMAERFFPPFFVEMQLFLPIYLLQYFVPIPEFLCFCNSSISLLKPHTYFYSHPVGIDVKCRGTAIYVKPRKKFVFQPQELIKNLVSAKPVVRLMFCLDSALDGVSPRVCKMVSLQSSC